MDGEVGPVHEGQEGVRVELLVVLGDEVLGLAEERLRPLGLDVPAGLDEVEVRAGHEQVGGRLVGDRVGGPSVWASGPNGSRCCGLAVRVLRSVSWRVHSWSETMPFQGASTSHSPSSIALARTTSSSAVSRATLPISLRYIRTGSSIPIMSAERASSSSGVGSSSSFASSFVGASTRAGAASASATTSSGIATDDVAVGQAVGHPEDQVVVIVIVVLVVEIDLGDGHAGLGRALRGEPRLLDLDAGAPRSAGEHRLDELLVHRILCHGFVVLRGQRRPVPAVEAEAPTAAAGRVRRRVCSIRRSSDRRASLIWRSSSRRRAIASWSARSSASACSAWFQALRSSRRSASRVRRHLSTL